MKYIINIINYMYMRIICLLCYWYVIFYYVGMVLYYKMYENFFLFWLFLFLVKCEWLIGFVINLFKFVYVFN